MEIEHQASRVLVRLARGDRAAARRITAAIGALAEDPRPAAATKLVGAGGWRIRIGDYRVVYRIKDAVMVVTVTRSDTAETSTRGEWHAEHRPDQQGEGPPRRDRA